MSHRGPFGLYLFISLLAFAVAGRAGEGPMLGLPVFQGSRYGVEDIVCA